MRGALSLALTALVATLPAPASAKFHRQENVRYETETNWSDSYLVDVTFATGFELNQATNSFDYDTFTLYAAVFWTNHEASIIKLTDFNMCGVDANESCLPDYFGPHSGTDQMGRRWEIRAPPPN